MAKKDELRDLKDLHLAPKTENSDRAGRRGERTAQERSQTPHAMRRASKTPSTGSTGSPSPGGNRRSMMRSREASADLRSFSSVNNRRPSCERTDRSVASGRTSSVYSQRSGRSSNTLTAQKTESNISTVSTFSNSNCSEDKMKQFYVLECQFLPLNNFHGYLTREDLTAMVKKPGDWLVRVSVLKERRKPQKKSQTPEKVTTERSLVSPNTPKSSDEKKRFVPKSPSMRCFMLSVMAKPRLTSPGKRSVCPLRNIPFVCIDNTFCLESSRLFKSISELLAYYTKNPGVNLGYEFQLVTPIPLASWEFSHADIELMEKKLGEGAFGEVRVGLLKSKSTPSRKVIEVAVKMLKMSAGETISRNDVAELLHEARLMRALEHPNVLRTYGIAVLREPLLLMTEICAHGALREYLKEHAKTITAADRISFILGSARGVEYLHSRRLIHRDLAVRNILLSEDKSPKVSDFGLAKQADRYRMNDACKMPVRYFAPETLDNFTFTPKTDVYSFGCVIWEIYENGEQPHNGKNAATIREQVQRQEFLKLNASAPESLRNLVATRIFTSDPEKRCSMKEVVQLVEKLPK